MARNNSRFNRLLNFIGLVDESEDQGNVYDDGRPQGASTYNPPARRSQTNARPVRGQEFDEPRYPQASRGYDDRYQGSPSSSRYQSQTRYDDYPPQRDYRQPSREPAYNGSRSSGAAMRRQNEYDRGPQRQDSYRQADYARDSYQPRDGYQPRNYQQPRQAAPRYDDYPPQRSAGRDNAPRMPEPREEPVRDNVVRLREGSGRAETMIFYLHQLEECREVITALLDNKTVLLNLEDMDERLIQRGIDTLCGAAFALNATLRKASDKTYLIAPNSVTVESSSDERY